MTPAALSTDKSFRDSALVLRTQDLGEHDRIIILCTPSLGIVHAVAKGVRKSSSKIGARLEPFMLVDVSARLGQKLATISQVVTRRAYLAPILGDYTRYTIAAVLAETAEQILNHEQERTREQFSLLAGALSSLARGTHHPYRVLDSYLLRAMHLAGWSMAITACGSCGETRDLQYFSPEVGVVCGPCARTGRFGGLGPCEPDFIPYLADLAAGRWPDIDQQPSSAKTVRVTHLIIDYVQWQLERRLKTLTTLEKEPLTV